MKVSRLICIIITIILASSFSMSCYRKVTHITEMDYREDVEPITKRFPIFEKIEKCYWKAEIIGELNFGLSSYWMKGFIVLTEKTKNELLNSYVWEQIELLFTEGIDPNITEFNNCDWAYNKDFSDEITRPFFIGDFYLDVSNGVIYFDLESM